MTDKEAKELKAAMVQMNGVVKSLQYHNKLKGAWRRLQKAAKPALPDRKDAQGRLFG